jgi:pilus assembly protein CpaB
MALAGAILQNSRGKQSMRPKTLILFIVAIGCGLVASIGVSQYMEKARGFGAVETEKIYVATTEISQNDRMDAKNVSLEEWPKDRIPEGAITDLKQLEDKFSRTRMYKGEPILQAKLSDAMDGGGSTTIPPGHRVVAVKVDETSSGAGLIRPGDRVDLVLFLRKSQDIPETTTKTILWDVNVFAVGGKLEREIDDKHGTSREVRSVSLLVSPKPADLVMLAKELGVLSLSLRRPGDASGEIGSGENVQSLLGRDGENANENKRQSTETEVPPWVADAQPPADPVEAPAPVEPPSPPAFTMKIRTNNGDHTFTFARLDGPPQEEVSLVEPIRTPAITPRKPAPSTPLFPAKPTTLRDKVQEALLQSQSLSAPEPAVVDESTKDSPAQEAGK